MKKIPMKARTEIHAAVKALELCLAVPELAPAAIHTALRHVTEANQWIVARVLLDSMKKEG
jgi:hypothetical protein